MQALQRQNQYQPQKTASNCLRPRKHQHTFPIHHHPTTPLKGIFNFQHRRKYRLPEFNQNTPSNPHRKSEQIESATKEEENYRKMAQTIRHTHHATELKDMVKERTCKMQTVVMREFTREGVRGNLLSHRTLFPEEFSKCRTAWKLKEKLSRGKEKAEKADYEQLHSKNLKKVDPFPETLCYLTEQSSFLNLIKKFKFQNLKPAVETDKCLHSAATNRKHPREQRKQETSFAPLRRMLQTAEKQNQPQSLANCYHDSKIKKMRKNAVTLSPWEMVDDPEFIIPIQIGQHI